MNYKNRKLSIFCSKLKNVCYSSEDRFFHKNIIAKFVKEKISIFQFFLIDRIYRIRRCSWGQVGSEEKKLFLFNFFLFSSKLLRTLNTWRSRGWVMKRVKYSLKGRTRRSRCQGWRRVLIVRCINRPSGIFKLKPSRCLSSYRFNSS